MASPREDETPPSTWVGGIDPAFDFEAHCGEPVFTGRDRAEARSIGYVGGTPACEGRAE